MIGAPAQVTSRPVTRLVTWPTVRMHPAVTAQAAATSATLLDGGFRFGAGAGEALNEHITGGAWPDAPVRTRTPEEALQVVRKLCTGDRVTHRGPHCTVANARLHTRERAIDTVHRLWPSEQLPGELAQVLPAPEHIGQASTLVTRDAAEAAGTFGDDPDSHVRAVRACAEAGFDEVYVAQIGPEQRQFFDAYRSKVLPALPDASA